MYPKKKKDFLNKIRDQCKSQFLTFFVDLKISVPEMIIDRQHFFGLPKTLKFEARVERTADFNCFLNGLEKTDFHLCYVVLALCAFSDWKSKHQTTEFRVLETFLSWIFTSACIKWWHFYNQTRLAATTTPATSKQCWPQCQKIC